MSVEFSVLAKAAKLKHTEVQVVEDLILLINGKMTRAIIRSKVQFGQYNSPWSFHFQTEAQFTPIRQRRFAKVNK